MNLKIFPSEAGDTKPLYLLSRSKFFRQDLYLSGLGVHQSINRSELHI